LPWLELDGFTSEWPLEMGQVLNERTQVFTRVIASVISVGELRVEAIGTGLALELGQVIQLPLARPLDPLAGEDLAGNDPLRIRLGYRGIASDWLCAPNTHA